MTKRLAAIVWGSAFWVLWAFQSDFAPHNMTSDTAPPPYVMLVDSGEYFPAYHMFDGLTGVSDTPFVYLSPSGTVGIDLGAGNCKSLYSYSLTNNDAAYAVRVPKDWTFQGSNTLSGWTTLDTVTGQTAWGTGENRSFTLSIPSAAFRYFRINWSANNGGGESQIAEMTLVGLPGTCPGLFPLPNSLVVQ